MSVFAQMMVAVLSLFLARELPRPIGLNFCGTESQCKFQESLMDPSVSSAICRNWKYLSQPQPPLENEQTEQPIKIIEGRQFAALRKRMNLAEAFENFHLNHTCNENLNCEQLKNSRFILQTFPAATLEWMTNSFISPYLEHIDQNPRSFLVRIVGVFKLENCVVVAMLNSFPRNIGYNYVFDLKASTLDQTAAKGDIPQGGDFKAWRIQQSQLESKGSSDILHRGGKLRLGDMVLSILRQDILFLSRTTKSEYSLLLAIRNVHSDIEGRQVCEALVETGVVQDCHKRSLEEHQHTILRIDSENEASSANRTAPVIRAVYSLVLMDFLDATQRSFDRDRSPEECGSQIIKFVGNEVAESEFL